MTLDNAYHNEALNAAYNSYLMTQYYDYTLDEEILTNGVYDYLLKMREEGVVKHIGLSSHTPAAINRIMDEAKPDMLMFSVNPGYDYQQGEFANGSVDDRAAIYKRCEAEGTGISVMKPFSGGQLLDSSLSPFGKALTAYQCLQYALDRPGVLTVLPGASNSKELKNILGFLSASDEEKDYSVIGTFSPADAVGKCVYCNHCRPCPVGIDIGLVNKYYDLSKNGDTLADEHYRGLSLNAGDCIHCGRCDGRCPFGVKQSDRMNEIAEYFKYR